MWESASGSSAGVDTTADFNEDECIALGNLLAHQDQLSLKHRKLVGVLLAAFLFQLGRSPWIGQQFSPDSIFVPPANKNKLQQWFPRVTCLLAPNQAATLQSDDIAAFGVLVLELEANRMAPWTESDYDWISGEKSNHVRLARILKSWEDLISDDYRGVARACLEFDSLVESIYNLDMLPDKKHLAIIYKFILEPLFCHTMKSFGNLARIFKKMFGHGHTPGALSVSPSSAAKRALFDDDASLSKPDDQ